MKIKSILLLTMLAYSCGKDSGSTKNSNSSQSKDKQPVPENPQRNPPENPDDNKTVVDRVIEHQSLRFKTLRKILTTNPKYILRIPGQSSAKHNLGTGIAKNAWNATGDLGAHKKMTDHISSLLSALEKDFPGRLTYGWIGDFKFDSATGNCNRNLANPSGKAGNPGDNPHIVDVWGANDGNFNYSNGKTGSFGSGQASCFSHQRPGVFGISTMPASGTEAFNRFKEDDKCISLY